MNTMQTRITQMISQNIEVMTALLSNQDMLYELEGIANKIIKSFVFNNGRLYLMGNGGSAADALHIAAEFIDYPCEALTANSCLITALANDFTYADIFVKQVKAKVRWGDIVIGISTSGESNNVLRGLDTANKLGACTVLLTGVNNTNPLFRYFNYVINVLSTCTPRIQEAHILIGHIIYQLVKEGMEKI